MLVIFVFRVTVALVLPFAPVPLAITTRKVALAPAAEKSNAVRGEVAVTAEPLSEKLKLIGAEVDASVLGLLTLKSAPLTACDAVTVVGALTLKSNGVIAELAVISELLFRLKSNGVGGPEVASTEGVSAETPDWASPTWGPTVLMVVPNCASTGASASRFSRDSTWVVCTGARLPVSMKISPKMPSTVPWSFAENP